MVIYESTLDAGHSIMFLDQEIGRRRVKMECFPTSRVKNLLSVLCEQVYLGSKDSMCYLELQPSALLLQGDNGGVGGDNGGDNGGDQRDEATKDAKDANK